MQIKLGDKIRAFRKRDGRRQDDLAAALGVTGQAVSRWEANRGYPDMEMIPAIANYFHVSIDELFGYNNDRETRLATYLEEADRMRGFDGGKCRTTPEEREEYLRAALEEFPNEWRLQLRLAWALQARAAKTGEKTVLREVEELLESARQNTDDPGWRDSITRMIADVCKTVGDAEKIERIALAASPAYICREVLRTFTPDEGKRERFYAEATLALLHELTQTLDRDGCDDPDVYLSLAEFYRRLFSESDYGLFHSDLCQLTLRAAYLAAARGDERAALDLFDTAYTHRLAFGAAWENGEHQPRAPYLCSAVDLPRRYVSFQGDALRDRVAAFPAGTAEKIRRNPRYAELFG